MAAKDLITLARAKSNLQSITDSSQDTRLATLITAASDAIEKYCRRDFYSRNFDELYSGTGEGRLLLRQYPIQSVKSVRWRPVSVLKITNSDTATNQQARVQVSSTGVVLTRIASGVTTTNTLTFASNVTLQALATAIIALAAGWSAQALGSASGDYGLWPSADLYVPTSYGDGTTSQGNQSARGQYAELQLHTDELAGYQFDPRGWLVRASAYTNPELLYADGLVWPVGVNNIRVQYAAGYTTIPEAVQEACAEWVAELYWLTLRDPAATHLVQPGVVNTIWQPDASHPSKVVQRLLAPYRRYAVGQQQG